MRSLTENRMLVYCRRLREQEQPPLPVGGCCGRARDVDGLGAPLDDDVGRIARLGSWQGCGGDGGGGGAGRRRVGIGRGAPALCGQSRANCHLQQRLEHLRLRGSVILLVIACECL